MVAGCLFLALPAGLAQNAAPKPQTVSAAAARGLLIEKAQTLEARGRPDLSIQLWQQILAADPNNLDALAGLASDLKLTGSSKSAEALERLRQALLHGASNPASVAALRDYLKDNPQDTELAARLREDESKLAQANSSIARTPEERAAFAALNSHQLDEAEKLFAAILAEDPNNGSAAAGMGFLRIQQNNFADAVHYLNQAEENGVKEQSVVDALASVHFRSAMGEAAAAFAANQLDVASTQYRQALTIHPHSPEVLKGLAGALAAQQKYAGAAIIDAQLIALQPNSADGWRGLFLAYAHDNQNGKALAVEARFPAEVKTALVTDPEYLRALVAIYRAENRPADAERVLADMPALPSAGNGTTVKPSIGIEYAGILMDARRYNQAADLYAQLLKDDAGNRAAWMGLVNAHHQVGENKQAIDDVRKMPPAVYQAALGDPAFLALLGTMDQQTGQYEAAQGLLERAVKLQAATGGQSSVALQLQLAGVYLLRGDTAHACDIDHHIIQNNPDNTDAWEELIAALLVAGRNPEALAQLALIPVPVRSELETGIYFLQSEAGIYAATGDTAHAVESMNRVEAYYAARHIEPPASLEIQDAWLLFNAHNDRALYPVLMRLSAHAGLMAAERETLQGIWANWSVRCAAAAMDGGNIQRAIDILDAASQAFPGNLAVRKAAAGGYERAGRVRDSLALYKTIPMQDATADDFERAIGAALTANDDTQAWQWLQPALDRFPRDPAILALAAHYEQIRGDAQRAADFSRAALAATPAAPPAEKPAGAPAADSSQQTSQSDADTNARPAVTAADLQRLLDPDRESAAKMNNSLSVAAGSPAPNNVAPSASSIPGKSASRPQDAPKIFPPSASEGQTPSAPVYIPQH
jgi:tetratricopeptide (TPR) repeat protein